MDAFGQEGIDVLLKEFEIVEKQEHYHHIHHNQQQEVKQGSSCVEGAVMFLNAHIQGDVIQFGQSGRCDSDQYYMPPNTFVVIVRDVKHCCVDKHEIHVVPRVFVYM